MSVQQSIGFVPAFGIEPRILAILVPDENSSAEDAFYSTWESGARPPKALAHVHDPHYFDDALRRIFDRVREPVQARASADGSRAVHVLGLAVFRFDVQGRIDVELWSVDEGLPAKLVAVPQSEISIDPVPCGNAWLARLEHGFAVELGRRHGLRGNEFGASDLVEYARWAFRIYRKKLRRHCDLRQMRRRIAEGLALDPQLLAIARRLRRRQFSGTQTRVDDYNAALAHRAEFETLLRESPNLIRAYASLRDTGRLPGDGEPAQRLKRCLRSDGISERGWRMIVRSRARLLDPIDEFYAGDAASATRDFLSLLDAIGFQDEPPHWFVRNLLQLHGNRNQRHPNYLDRCGGMIAVSRHVARIIEGADPATLARVRDELHEVLTWLCDAGIASLDKRQRRAGWPWLAARAAEWALVEEVRARAGNERWRVPFDELTAGSWSVHAIADSLGLWEEGRTMRHCAHLLAGECESGALRLFSIRDAATGKRFATLGCRRGPRGWIVWQVAGFANKSPLRRVASAVAATMTRLQGWEHARASAARGVDDARDDATDPDVDETLELHDAVVRAVRGDGLLDDETFAAMAQWLDEDAGASMGDMQACGQLLPEEQEDDWRGDPQAWIETAVNVGQLSTRRGEALAEGASLTPRDEAILRRVFRRHALSGEADADFYPAWYLFRIRGRGKRRAWVLATVKGYSFTGVVNELVGVYGSRRGAMRGLREVGRYSR